MAILSGTTELQISKSSPLMQNSLFLFQSRAYGLRKRLKINKKNGVGNRTKASFSNSYNSLISPSLQLPTHMYRFVFELLFDGRTPQHSLLGDCSRKMKIHSDKGTITSIIKNVEQSRCRQTGPDTSAKSVKKEKVNVEVPKMYLLPSVAIWSFQQNNVVDILR